MVCVPPPRVLYAAPELALYTPARWDARRVLRVRFLDGDTETQRRIAAIEAGPEGWSSASEMQFRFVEQGEAEIRVTLAEGASWSHVGMGCLGVPVEQPTMQLGWAHRSDDTELRRVWLHEAGHALGFVHEHGTQQAMTQLPWDWPAFDAWHRARGLDVEDARRRWQEEIIAAPVVAQGRYDPDSIMGYYMPGAWFTDGVTRGGANRLSADDRRLVAEWYGEPSSGPPRTDTDGGDTWLPVIIGSG
jgi:hypothetical protein